MVDATPACCSADLLSSPFTQQRHIVEYTPSAKSPHFRPRSDKFLGAA